MSSFHDYFSAHADAYARYRPSYPAALSATLARLAPRKDLAWDVGTGNGQAALMLATHFERVVATDPSASQLQRSTPHPRVEYRVERGEASSLADGSVALINIAQALHWLDFDRFFTEVTRVAQGGAIFAAITYGLAEVDVPQANEAQALVWHLYAEKLEPYWPPQRQHVEADYRTVALPFPKVDLPEFIMEAHWTAADFLGYLRTWSADKRHQEATGHSAVDAIASELSALWPDPATPARIAWPLTVLCGRVTR